MNNNRFLQILLFTFLISMMSAGQLAEAAYTCNDDTVVESAAECDSHDGVASCGDGIVGGDEECDRGSQNSDTEPDGCRTQYCVRAYCGDGVADSAEQCDGDAKKGAICSDFKRNGENYWSGSLSCNYDCSLDLSECHYCGDGLTQSPQEQL